MDVHAHLLNLQAGNVHAADDIGKQRDHVVVAHGHVGDNLLEGNLLAMVGLVLFASRRLQFLSEFGHLALLEARIE